MPSDDELGELLKEHTRFSQSLVFLALLGVVPIIFGFVLLLLPSESTDVLPRHILSVRSTLPPFPSQLPKKTETTASSSTEKAKIPINYASQSELETLPGIGEVRAKQIMQSRPYKDILELDEKTSLPASIIESISSYVSF